MGKRKPGGTKSGAAKKAAGRKEPQARSRPEALEQADGIPSDLDKGQSPAKILLERMSARDPGADEVVTPRDDDAPVPAEALEAAPDEPREEPPVPAEIQDEAEEAPASGGLDALLESVSREGLEPRPEEPEVELDIHLDRADRIPLEIYVKVVKGERVARALTADISESGIFLAAMALPVVQAGDHVLLELPLPGLEEPIWAQGEVVREATSKGFHQTGIRFTHLSEPDRLAIREYVETRARFV